MVNIIEPGNVFGELGLIYNRLRSATMVALPGPEAHEHLSTLNNLNVLESSILNRVNLPGLNKFYLGDKIVIAYLTKPNYQSIFQKYQKKEQGEKNGFIKKHVLNDPLVQYYSPKFGIMWEKEEFDPATVLLQQGEVPQKVYLLVSGNVELSYNWKEQRPNSSRHIL